ncbi:hypothetical protein EGW08_023174 [Elysia chlorotica]|uniref:Serine protease n=1 Tax=Elysia chlorotica TaxID=188477 RepID=A0A3S0Z4A0_ELYCH|nr:hypothetical protein EGW08_023174 [Elysia chlorotica]
MAYKGHHECEILGSGPEAAESALNWEKCRKNPGHEQFISAGDFIENHLPRLETCYQRDRLRARIDLTVRLRVNWTSLDRPSEDQLSQLRGRDRLRCGTGFVDDVSDPVTDKPCFCNECDGKVTRKHWTFTVDTAQHVVYNAEEARNTRLDFFYDDENINVGNGMKSVWALRVERSSPDTDISRLFCVTHDEDLGERIKSLSTLWNGSKKYPLDLSSLKMLPSRNRKGGPAIIVSHPHGQPKKITVGRATDKEHPLVKYNIPTCPGSSGAPIFQFYPHLANIPYINYCRPIHSGSYNTYSWGNNKGQTNSLVKFFKNLTGYKNTQDQKNYGYNW